MTPPLDTTPLVTNQICEARRAHSRAAARRTLSYLLPLTLAAISAAIGFAVTTTRDNARQDAQITATQKLLDSMDHKLDTLLSNTQRRTQPRDATP